MSTDITADIKKIVKKGKEDGYILISELNEIIRDGMEELEIQVVKTPKDYDEYKYMTGEEAIAFLQGLSDGKTKAFVKEEE